MLGVFSSSDAGLSGSISAVTRYYIREDFRVDIQLDQWNQELVSAQHTWETRESRDFAILPNEVADMFVDLDEELRVTRGEECGPHDIQIYNGSGAQAGWKIYRGEVCVDYVDDGGGVESGSYIAYWCAEPPPECQADSE